METGPWGSHNQVAMHEDEFEDFRFVLNLDAAGGAGKKDITFNDFPELEPSLEKGRRR